jgi:DNA-binding NarL/FixJ family response regulator
LVTAQIIQENLQKNPSRTANSIPIVIMVTAYTREELLAQPGIVWVDGVLSKPVTPSALYNTIARIINGAERSGTVSEAAVPLPNQRLPGVRMIATSTVRWCSTSSKPTGLALMWRVMDKRPWIGCIAIPMRLTLC